MAASHVQTRRQQPDRAPGVLHRATPGAVPKFSAAARRDRQGAFSRWRLISAVLLALFGLTLLAFFTSDVFFVRAIQVRGNTFITREEVFTYSELANYHMFWLDPDEIRDKLLRSPSVADLDVEVGWPPDLVTLLVQERQPAIVWSDAGDEIWIDILGRVMPARAEMPGLLHVNLVNDDFSQPSPRVEDFSKDMVLGALRLRQALPEGDHLDYHPIHGLGWTNEQGWQIWMGTDSAAVMDEKIKIYDVLVENLNSRAIDVAELNIANPDAPFYRLLWGL